MKNQLHYVITRAIIILVIFTAMLPGFVFSQNKIGQFVLEKKNKGHFEKRMVPFSVITNNAPELLKVVKKFSILKLDNTVLHKILRERPEDIKLVIPFENGAKNFTILLFKTDVSTTGYNLLTN